MKKPLIGLTLAQGSILGLASYLGKFGQVRIICPDEHREDLDLLVLYTNGGLPTIGANTVGNIPYQPLIPVDTAFDQFYSYMFDLYKGTPMLAIHNAAYYLAAANKGKIQNNYTLQDNGYDQFLVKSHLDINSISISKKDRVGKIVYLPDTCTPVAKNETEIGAFLTHMGAGVVYNPLEVNDNGLFDSFVEQLLPRKNKNDDAEKSGITIRVGV